MPYFQSSNVSLYIFLNSSSFAYLFFQQPTPFFQTSKNQVCCQISRQQNSLLFFTKTQNEFECLDSSSFLAMFLFYFWLLFFFFAKWLLHVILARWRYFAWMFHLFEGAFLGQKEQPHNKPRIRIVNITCLPNGYCHCCNS